MSRLGKIPLAVPKGVEFKLSAGGALHVKGPKGSLDLKLPTGITLKVEGAEAVVERNEKLAPEKALHGLWRALIKNALAGVMEGYEVLLDLVGVGYRANVVGQKLDLQLGFSHPTALPIPKGLVVAVDKGIAISIKGVDKHLVGQFAAAVRAMKPPEPYKGKGIRYRGEYVRKKEGKAAKGKT